MGKPTIAARWLWVLFVLCGSVPLPSFAETPSPSTGVQAFLDFPLAKVETKLGEWARYRVHTTDGSVPDREMIVGLVHRSAPYGAAWLEIQTQLPDETPVAWRALIRLLDGSGQVGALELKIADHPPLSIDPPKKATSPPAAEKKIEQKETLETPAGTFDCSKVEVTSPDHGSRTLWISDKAPFGGMVKATEKATELLLINVHEHGFVSHFNEKETLSLKKRDREEAPPK